ncbi:MAG: deoxyribodipyrimidine photo-lyase, partial [bacterium]
MLYWMQASQRSEYNHALEFAIEKADQFNMPLVVFFGITDRFPDANERHYFFMLEGLRETRADLEKRGIKMVIRHISPEMGTVEMAAEASLVIADRGYLKIQKDWRAYVAKHLDCPVIQVESDVIVPVEVAYPKEAYSAAVIRPKIKRHLEDYLLPLDAKKPKKDSVHIPFDSFDIQDILEAVRKLDVDRSVKPVDAFHGGSFEAKKHLKKFLGKKLDLFQDLRNDPTVDYLSHMSPYLHFGQISPLYIAMEVLKSNSPGRDAYIEELVIRRELSMNFVFYNENYASFLSLPAWARKTLKNHQHDPREYNYTPEEMERGQTH